MTKISATILILLFSLNCSHQVKSNNKQPSKNANPEINNSEFDTLNKTIHVLVALCDNKYQGIVPVPLKIGNGQDPDNNLYWGCAFGIRSFFKNSKNWTLLKHYY